MLNKKGIVPLMGAGIVLVIALVGLLFVPGVVGTIQSIIAGPNSCEDAPFDGDCFCLATEDRIEGSSNSHYCEDKNKVINIDDEGWEESAEAYVEQKLEETYGSCDMKTCEIEGGNTRWVIYGGSQINGIDYLNQRRMVFAECEEVDKGFRFAGAWVNVVDGSTERMWCANFDDIVQETISDEPAKLTGTDKPAWGQDMNNAHLYNNNGDNYERWRLNVGSSCRSTDNGLVAATVTTSRTDIQDWRIGCSEGYTFKKDANGDVIKPRIMLCGNQAGEEPGKTGELFTGSCSVQNEGTSSVDIVCDTQCPHAPFSNDGLELVAYFGR